MTSGNEGAAADLDELAATILAGRAIDWNDVALNAPASDLPIVEQLRLLAEIESIHRSLPPVEPEREWAHLRRLEKVGQGSFGEVFRAWDSRLDREVALKILHSPADTESAAGRSVIEEGRLLARVRHPNVVTVYGADIVDGEIGIWTEFVRGTTLDQWIRDRGPVDAAEAAEIGDQICGALAAVHAAGLLHGDIKARNVMREEDGRLVLMDFGAGRDALRADDADFATGTPLYLAPELFAGTGPSVASDIYSLSVLLFHLVTGSYPVVGETPDEIRNAHREGRRTPLRELRPDLGEKFVAAVERGLHSDPAERHSSSADLGAALRRGAPVRAAFRSRRLWIAAFASVAVAGAGLLFLTRNRPATASQPGSGAPFPTRNPEAYALYLRGRAALEGLRAETARTALQYFERATALDPGFAQAQAGIAHAYTQLNFTSSLPAKEAGSRAHEAAAKALALGPELAETHVAAAVVKLRFESDSVGVLREARRAIELDPRNASAHLVHAMILALLGRRDESIAEALRAEELDPLSPRARYQVALVYRYARRYDDCIAQIERVLELDSNYKMAYMTLGHCYRGAECFAESLEAYRNGGCERCGASLISLVGAGRRDEALSALAELEAEDRETGGLAHDLAQGYMAIGNFDRAFEMLTRELDEGDLGAGHVVMDNYDALRSDPRFAALLARAGLPAAEAIESGGRK